MYSNAGCAFSNTSDETVATANPETNNTKFGYASSRNVPDEESTKTTKS